MKKLIGTFLFLFALSALSAQDLIYTVSAEIDQQKTSLDSILVENLSNDTRILFDELPALEYYQINLTKNAFWGTVGASDTEIKPEFVETRNLPGLIQLAYRGISPVEARLSVFNINGQLVYTTNRKVMFPGNSIQVQLAATGVYFVQIQSPMGTKTFKAIGSENQSDYGVKITDETTAGVKFKSSFLTLASDFSFIDGDSLRISVYKEEYYARPSSFRANASKYVNFEFRVSSVTETGISDAYVAIDEITTNVTAYDTLSGQVILEYSGEKPELKPGDIITVDADTAGYLRKVVEAIDEEGVITVETEQAYFDEVFVDMEIKLHTSLMNPGVQLKSTSSPREISKALTDDDGYIHPVEVIYHGADGRTMTKSAITDTGTSEERIPLIDFYRDLKMDLYGKEGENIRFYIDEGHVSLTSDVVFEFDLKYKDELDENTKVKRGDLNTFRFYLDSEARFLTKLVLEMNKSIEKENTKKLIDLDKVTAKFFVGPVPVWITFDVDIFSKYQFSADASLYADWGFESNHTLQIGGTYDKKSDGFTPISEYTPENTVFPMNIEGEINAFARMEVYPRAEIMFYSFFGPYAEIVPYVQGNYNAALQSQVTGGGAETFLAWNSGIDLGLDFRVGTKLSFLWGLVNREYGPTILNCFETPLWQTPVNLELLTELPEQADGGTAIPLKFKVTDLWGLPVSLCPVYIEGNGTFSKQIVFANTSGEVTVNWTLPSSSGNAEFTATIYQANGNVIKQINRWVQVSGSAPSVTTLTASVITETSATLNGEVSSDGGATITERGFYWSETRTNPGPTTGGTKISVSGTTGNFNRNLTSLKSNTTYYYRAFATNAEGIGTGSVLSFETNKEQGVVGDWPRDTQTAVVDVTNPATGKTWMDRNLGASRAATSSTDAEAYGDLYQWGRAADGHQKRNSATTSSLSSSDTPGHGNFILASNSPYDWRSPQNTNLWQGVNGINNPCPAGYRLPTEAELNAECQSWSSDNATGAFASPLKLPVAGIRHNNGSLYFVGSGGFYWSSTSGGTDARHLSFFGSNASVRRGYRVSGSSVRCLKDN